MGGCSTGGDAAPARESQSCPSCGERGKSVATRTVKLLVRDHTRVSAEGRYRFCPSPGCDVVYFGSGGSFRKADIKVRVGIKEQDDPIPLCYCFDYTRADIRRDIEKYGRSEIPERVKAEVQAGFCACEVKNPSGHCCLGELYRAVQQARALVGGIGHG